MIYILSILLYIVIGLLIVVISDGLDLLPFKFDNTDYLILTLFWGIVIPLALVVMSLSNIGKINIFYYPKKLVNAIRKWKQNVSY